MQLVSPILSNGDIEEQSNQSCSTPNVDMAEPSGNVQRT